MLQKTIILPATLQAVSHFSAELESWFMPLRVETRVGVVLAVQELCVNIVKHAYCGQEGEIQIKIDWTLNRLYVHVVDQAPNHLVMPEVIKAPDPLALQENGMGLFLIHQAFDQVEYQPICQGKGNQWRLFKHLDK